MKQVAIGLCAMLLALLLAFAIADKPEHIESPPEGIPPSEFATDYQGCLSELRSAIARGEFNGVGPFGEHFTGEVNPGKHQGTVGEEEFLRDVIGIEDVEGFCNQEF